QRVAIGSVLTAHPKVLVLDEPTSALDPAAAEEVLAVLQRLVHDLGTTVLMAEHRLERVVQYADQVILLPGPGAAPVMGDPDGMLVADAEPVLTVAGLGVQRDRVPVLHGVGLTVRPGETVALMGRNGAGKSTLLRSLVGMHRPSAGTVRVGGAVPHQTRPRDL